jgi:hypothetical protein
MTKLPFPIRIPSWIWPQKTMTRFGGFDSCQLEDHAISIVNMDYDSFVGWHFVFAS